MNTYVRIMSACFAGGVTTLLALVLLVPGLGAWAIVGITLAGALLGYILAAPIAFVRAIPNAFQGVARSLVDLIVFLVAFVFTILRPRPIGWICQGVPSALVLYLFAESMMKMPVQEFGFGAWIFCIWLFALSYVLCSFPLMFMMWFAEELSPRFWGEGRYNSWVGDTETPYWYGRFRHEIYQRGGHLEMNAWLPNAPVKWSSAVVYVLDLTIGTLVRALYRAGGFAVFIAWEFLRFVFVEIPGALWKLFKTVHTDVRLICMIDTPLGALITFLTLLNLYGPVGEVLTRPEFLLWTVFAGIASAMFGLINYALVAKHWLGITPANEFTPQE